MLYNKVNITQKKCIQNQVKSYIQNQVQEFKVQCKKIINAEAVLFNMMKNKLVFYKDIAALYAML